MFLEELGKNTFFQLLDKFFCPTRKLKKTILCITKHNIIELQSFWNLLNQIISNTIFKHCQNMFFRSVLLVFYVFYVFLWINTTKNATFCSALTLHCFIASLVVLDKAYFTRCLDAYRYFIHYVPYTANYIKVYVYIFRKWIIFHTSNIKRNEKRVGHLLELYARVMNEF